MKIKFNARSLMEQAIGVMLQSVKESRKDGKATPLVGAVIFKPDGIVETAHRGEIRDGDHAEFTLLERKNLAIKLDDTVLFTTLEPCAPGSRSHPKLSCAERIVLARIKEVWVGIEDIDPKVDRKGIQFLQDNKVNVHMFDRDLQDKIRKVNKKYLEQALVRADIAREEKKPKIITLSPLENEYDEFIGEYFSKQALEQYRINAQIDDNVGSPEMNRRLLQQGLLKLTNGKYNPTGFGLILFGKEPRTMMPEVGLLGTIHLSDGTEEIKDFDSSQVLVPEQALEWLRAKLSDPIDRTESHRQSVNDELYELVREGIVNAIIHRDYSVKEAKCHLIVTADTITVKSPGMPVEPITLEELQTFNAPMLSRNPVLHYVFAKMGMAEERGLGLKSMKMFAEKTGLPLPKYSWEDPYLVLTIYRSTASAVSSLSVELIESLSESERSGWEWLATKQTVKSNEYAVANDIPERTALNHLKHFTELKLLQKLGSGSTTHYKVLR